MVKCAKAQFSKERLILACEIPDCNHFFAKIPPNGNILSPDGENVRFVVNW